MRKIVRKALDKPDVEVAFWVEPERAVVVGMFEVDGAHTTEEIIAGGSTGWLVTERFAARIGTTLAALRAELEGGEGNGS